MSEIKIVYDDDSREDILEIFGKSTDEEGYLVEKDNPIQRVVTKKGEEIHIDEWAGVDNGSESFIKKDAFSLIELAKKL